MAAEDAEKTYPENTEALPTPAGEPLEACEGEAPADDGAEEGKKRKRAVPVAVAAVAALALAGGAVAWAVSAQAPDAPAPAAEKKSAASVEKKDAAAKSEVKVTLTADGAEAAAAEAKVKIVKGGLDAVAEREAACNEAVSLGELGAGDYELVVTSAPVLEDGTTYRLPDAPAKFSVDGEGEPVAVECALSRIAKDDMSKEQLEAAAGALEAAGKAEAAAGVARSAQGAQSVPGSEGSVKQSAPAPGAPSGGSEQSGGGSTPAPAPSSPSGEGQTGPSEPHHVHSYTTPIYGDGAPIYGNGAPVYGNGGPIIEEHCYCSICGEISGAEYSGGHNIQHALEGVSSSTWIDEIVVGYEQIVTGYEQIVTGYEQVVVGHQCSCGATQ